jgi:two-component system phosphate regulon sensor histidine kinase PhoR
MKSRIFTKMMLAAVLVILVATAVFDINIRRVWGHSLERQARVSLEQKTKMYAARLKRADSPDLATASTDVAQLAQSRATVVDSSGRALFDSAADVRTMENQASRPEIAAALQGKVGSDIRQSKTVGSETLYVAVPIEGGVVRLAYPLSEIKGEMAHVRRILLLNSVTALLLAGLFAVAATWIITRRLHRIMLFSERIAAGDLSARVDEHSQDEIGKVAAALDRTANTIEQNFKEIAASRAQFESLLNSLQDAVFAVNAEGRILWANGAMHQIARTRIGDKAGEVIRDPDVTSAIEQARQGRATSSARAFTVIPGHAYQVSAAPLPPNGAVVLLHDITNIDRMEKMRRDFVANVSHELRTPLTLIQGYAETLRDNGVNDSHNYLEIICRNAARMSRLTEDLLMLARVESGELKLRLAAVSASELLEDAQEAFADAAESKQIALRIAASTDVTAQADKDAVHQVFTNLIANALNYASGTGEILIGASPRKGFIDFWVKDNGPGISSEHQPRLFERFYRIDRARSRETGGTGLGLAIVKHIVLAHGGDVRVESKLGAGATFHFTLPVAKQS